MTPCKLSFLNNYLIFIYMLTILNLHDIECSSNKYRDPDSDTPVIEEISEPAPQSDAAAGRRGYVFRDTKPSRNGFKVEWDPNGYLFHCLAMGRIGNQMEHFLGSLAFAKKLNRTYVLPPLRTYRNVRFTEMFRFEPLLEYHRVVLAEDFLEILAPNHWPPSDRVGYCTKSPNIEYECTLKDGYPSELFWNDLGVDFVRYRWLDVSYQFPDEYAKRYTAEKYPVLAVRGSPAPYPMLPENWHIQQYLQFSDRIEHEAFEYIDKNFMEKKFVGIHIRNGADWGNACKSIPSTNSYMASPQCLHGTRDVVTKKMCLPDKAEILRHTREMLVQTRALVLFVATDHDPMMSEFNEHLADLQVRVFHMNPHLPQVDQAILIYADHFIGNCISSFTSFVTRSRRVRNKPTSFWGYSS